MAMQMATKMVEIRIMGRAVPASADVSMTVAAGRRRSRPDA
jgi:hypothetical protein